MVDQPSRPFPIRFVLSPQLEALSLRSSGLRPCNAVECTDTTGLVAFGPGLGLGLATTARPGFLFQFRGAFAYHWGEEVRVLRTSAGTTLSETSRILGIWSLNAQVAAGVQLSSVAFYAFGELFYAESTEGGLKGYGFGPGFGFSAGPQRLFSVEAAYYPLFRPGAYPEDSGNGFAVRAAIDLMALLSREPRARPAPEPPPAFPPVQREPQPLQPQPPPREIETIREEGNLLRYVGPIRFKYDSAEIRDDGSYHTLDLLARYLTLHAEIRRLEIHGHTDDQGPHRYNDELSRRRASAVRRALIDRGVLPARLRAIGHGERQPLAPGTSPEARALNRRVEFHIVERR